MYRKYDDVAGFDIRLGSKKLNSLGGVQTRYFVCSREGNPPKKEFDSLEVSSGERKRRNTNLKRTGCKACLKVHYVKESGRYEVYHFIEGHNHMLCCSDEKMFTRSRRQLDYKDRRNVVHDVRDESFDCSCNHFVRNGILCRHAFKVMLNSEVQSIPEKYILPRWRRELVPNELMPARVRYGEMDVEKQALINQAISMFDLIIGRVRNDKGALTEFVEQLERLGDEILVDVPILTSTEQKRNDIQELLCVTEPESVDVLPPTGVRNKGCGTRKRLVGMSERVSMNA
ncbi:FAR1 DNA binding domain-containing protein [Cynara cardunculus var. scolymus]|uniref:FAR1 DNA binding domain-containing protein n=1 Tax=Cynara cardunculus var. scolymus TaxID=59895 RepID=A0A103YCR5_CYNCS|nr:FAR1 DNA binding domain-containing protein [Cynara cardunculus var. scolymus]